MKDALCTLLKPASVSSNASYSLLLLPYLMHVDVGVADPERQVTHLGLLHLGGSKRTHPAVALLRPATNSFTVIDTVGISVTRTSFSS